MNREPIAFDRYQMAPVVLWDIQSMLLTSGDFRSGHFNTMTVGWGSVGYIWRRPFVQVVVRPTRYTYEFMERYSTFTLCAFPKKFKHAISLLGTKSGRDGNKILEAGLKPLASEKIAAPGFEEAELIIECQKIYWDDLDSRHFTDPGIGAHYPQKDFHRIYFGEILNIMGEKKYIYSVELPGDETNLSEP